MTEGQTKAWRAALDLFERKPTGWALIGGQLVHLHCAERGAVPHRPTDDIDAVLDVRAEPTVLIEVTAILADLGFEPVTTGDGHQHRWVSDGAVIDVLVPRYLGERAARRIGVGGATTIGTPGAQQALDRSETVDIRVDDRAGAVRRPTLFGALVAKAAAYSVYLDPARERHLIDFAVLASLVTPADLDRAMRPLDRSRLNNVLGVMARDQRRAWTGINGAEEGLVRLRTFLAPALAPGERPPRPTPWPKR